VLLTAIWQHQACRVEGAFENNMIYRISYCSETDSDAFTVIVNLLVEEKRVSFSRRFVLNHIKRRLFNTT